MRVYDTSHLAKQSIFGDALSVVDEFDRRKRIKKMERRDDARYADALERQKVMRGREDTEYRQSQEDRTQALTDADTARQHRLQDRKLALEDRALALEDRERNIGRQVKQDARAEQTHDAAMARENEWQQSAGYRRELEKYTIAAKKMQMDDAKTQAGINALNLKHQKIADKKADMARHAQKLDALIDNGAPVEQINKSIRDLASVSGMNIETIDGDYQMVHGLGDHLANGGRLDDPEQLAALQVLWKPMLEATGRGTKYKLTGMRDAGDNSFIPQFEYTDGSGKVSFQTHGASSDPEDLLEKFDSTEIMDRVVEYDHVAKAIKTVRDAHGLNPQEQPIETEKLSTNQRLVNSQTGEVLVDAIAEPEAATSPQATKQSEILMKSYEDDADVQAQMAHSVLSEKGIVSQQAVKQAKEIAGEDGDINAAATLVASRIKRQQVVAAGTESAKNALKRRIDQFPGITAEQVDLLKDSEVKKILKRFGKKDEMTQKDFFTELAQAVQARALEEQKQAEKAEKQAKREPYKPNFHKSGWATPISQ